MNVAWWSEHRRESCGRTADPESDCHDSCQLPTSNCPSVGIGCASFDIIRRPSVCSARRLRTSAVWSSPSAPSSVVGRPPPCHRRRQWASGPGVVTLTVRRWPAVVRRRPATSAACYFLPLAHCCFCIASFTYASVGTAVSFNGFDFAAIV
jgi:hypothetical protein